MEQVKAMKRLETKNDGSSSFKKKLQCYPAALVTGPVFGHVRERSLPAALASSRAVRGS